MVDKELLAAEYFDIDFKYPEDYKSFLKNMNQLDGTPWWLIGVNKGLVEKCFHLINVHYKSKKLLIPFAKSEETIVLACFDQSHRVWICGLENDDIANANWEKRPSIPNFSAWLNRVLSGDL